MYSTVADGTPTLLGLTCRRMPLQPGMTPHCGFLIAYLVGMMIFSFVAGVVFKRKTIPCISEDTALVVSIIVAWPMVLLLAFPFLFWFLGNSLAAKPRERRDR